MLAHHPKTVPLVRASHEYDRVRSTLLSSLADAHARYQTASATLQYYGAEVLVDQVCAYRALYDRYQEDRDKVGFNDVVTAQQTLVGAVASYLQSLGDQWQSVADLAGLLQVDDLYQLGQSPSTEPAVPTP
jgi:outer membrane protein TolC